MIFTGKAERLKAKAKRLFLDHSLIHSIINSLIKNGKVNKQ